MSRRRLLSWLLVAAALLLGGCASTGGAPGEPPPKRRQVADINVKLGLAYLEQGKLDLAQTKLERALRAAPRYSQAHWAYALLKERLGELEAAERHYRKAVRYDPDDARAWNNFGVFLCRIDKVREGLAAFEKAADNPLYKTPWRALTNAGLCALQHGREVRAEEYLRRALEVNPRYATALYEMAVLTYDQKRYLTARAYQQRLADALGRPDPKALWLCARIERALANYDEARRCARELRRRFPTAREAAELEAP